MKDPYRITGTPAEAPRSALRGILWCTLILAAAANAVFSTMAGNPLVSSAFGLIAVGCAAALIVHHYRNRAR